jgi:hypothetical protein
MSGKTFMSFILTHTSEINGNKSNLYKKASYDRCSSYEMIIYQRGGAGKLRTNVKRRVTKVTYISMNMHDWHSVVNSG